MITILFISLYYFLSVGPYVFLTITTTTPLELVPAQCPPFNGGMHIPTYIEKKGEKNAKNMACKTQHLLAVQAGNKDSTYTMLSQLRLSHSSIGHPSSRCRLGHRVSFPQPIYYNNLAPIPTKIDLEVHGSKTIAPPRAIRLVDVVRSSRGSSTVVLLPPTNADAEVRDSKDRRRHSTLNSQNSFYIPDATFIEYHLGRELAAIVTFVAEQEIVIANPTAGTDEEETTCMTQESLEQWAAA